MFTGLFNILFSIYFLLLIKNVEGESINTLLINNDISNENCFYDLYYWSSSLYIKSFSSDILCSLPQHKTTKFNNIFEEDTFSLLKSIRLDKSESNILKLYYLTLTLNRENGIEFETNVFNLISLFEIDYDEKSENKECLKNKELCLTLCSQFNIEGKCNYFTLFKYILNGNYIKNCLINDDYIHNNKLLFNDEETLEYGSDCIKLANDMNNIYDSIKKNEICGLSENTEWTIIFGENHIYEIPEICCDNCEVIQQSIGYDNMISNEQLQSNQTNECFIVSYFNVDSEFNTTCSEEPINTFKGICGETCVFVSNTVDSFITFCNGTYHLFTTGTNCGEFIGITESTFPICVPPSEDNVHLKIESLDCSEITEPTDEDNVATIIGIVTAILIIFCIIIVVAFFYSR